MVDNREQKNGSKTVTDLSDKAAKTGDRGDRQGGQAPDGQNAADGTPAAISDRNRKGQFVPGNVGGPGRGHLSDDSETRGTGAGGEGVPTPAGLMDMLARGFGKAGQEKIDEFVEKNTASAAQLYMNLGKALGRGGAAGGEPPNISFGDQHIGIAQAIMDRPVPHDLEGLDPDALRVEVARLQVENERLQRAANDLPPVKAKDDKPLMAEPSKEAIECIDCKAFTKIGGRMIEPFSKCRFCGQTYADSTAKPLVWTRNRPVPDPDERPTSGIAISIPLDGGERGWKPVADLSTGAIREALDSRGPDRGIF